MLSGRVASAPAVRAGAVAALNGRAGVSLAGGPRMPVGDCTSDADVPMTPQVAVTIRHHRTR